MMAHAHSFTELSYPIISHRLLLLGETVAPRLGHEISPVSTEPELGLLGPGLQGLLLACEGAPSSQIGNFAIH